MISSDHFFSLSKQDSAILKGIAILAMLFHHLSPAETVLFRQIGEWGKVCVAMFLFCSGYGLSIQYAKFTESRSIRNSIRFLTRRLIKFYSNYWVIFILFVPISLFLFGRTLIDAYGSGVNLPKHLFLDFLGIEGFNSYNVTWWFNKLILIFYILFPGLYWIGQRFPWGSLVLSLLAGIVYRRLGLGGYWALTFLYLFPFMIGITWTRLGQRSPFVDRWCLNHRYLLLGIALVLIIVCSILRKNPLIGVRMDGPLTAGMALIVLCLKTSGEKLRSLFAFLGTHSANIYLLHTFWNEYWPTASLIQSTIHSDTLRFLCLLILCIFSSLFIEWIKNITGYRKVTRIISESI